MLLVPAELLFQLCEEQAFPTNSSAMRVKLSEEDNTMIAPCDLFAQHAAGVGSAVIGHCSIVRMPCATTLPEFVNM